MRAVLRLGGFILILIVFSSCRQESSSKHAATFQLRVMTFNVEDIRQPDLENPDHPRLKKIAEIIARLRPDIIFINEIAYDQPGAPGFRDGQAPGQNARRLVQNFLAPLGSRDSLLADYQAYMAPSNTGISSGFDLNNDGRTVTTFPPPPPSGPDGSPGPQTTEGRRYGNDCWGFGAFPGQYAMALLINKKFTLLADQIRTFQLLPWSAMPEALLPVDPQTGQPWYNAQEWEVMRLSSKSHWDVPVQLPNGAVLHLLCSHPTPPAFDGPEMRNKLRNHDEIRFWADYLNRSSYIVDDRGAAGGLAEGALFLIMGDQNADPDEGNSYQNPIQSFLLSHPGIRGDFVPRANIPIANLDDDDTAQWGLRVDYLLPSQGLQIVDGGIYRSETAGAAATFPSDHFPVWLDLRAPAPNR